MAEWKKKSNGTINEEEEEKKNIRAYMNEGIAIISIGAIENNCKIIQFCFLNEISNKSYIYIYTNKEEYT